MTLTTPGPDTQDHAPPHLYQMNTCPCPGTPRAGYFKGADGALLRYAYWRQDGDRGTVCVFGGRREFIEKYYEVIADLLERGFSVAAMDWRGQGLSARPLKNRHKGHIDDFSEYESDLARFMSEIVLPECPAPFYAVGHSMGGHVLLKAACTRDCWFERIALVAPMIRLTPQALHVTILSGIVELAVYLGLGDAFIPGGSGRPDECLPFEDNPLSSDYDRYHRACRLLQTYTDLGIGAPTFGWVHAAVRSMREVDAPDFPAKVHVPILMIAAGQDQIVSNRAIEELSGQLKAGGHVVVYGSRHELMMERDIYREQFWAAFDAYIPGKSRY